MCGSNQQLIYTVIEKSALRANPKGIVGIIRSEVSSALLYERMIVT